MNKKNIRIIKKQGTREIANARKKDCIARGTWESRKSIFGRGIVHHRKVAEHGMAGIKRRQQKSKAIHLMLDTYNREMLQRDAYKAWRAFNWV